MKKCRVLLLLLVITCSVQSLYAQAKQKWSDLSKEEKMMKLQAFREDNQKYLKDSLKLSEDQLNDVDNVNVCYLSTLDRISRYGKTDADKEKYAQAVTSARSSQLDAIMGVDKRKKFANYVANKVKNSKMSFE